MTALPLPHSQILLSNDSARTTALGRQRSGDSARATDDGGRAKPTLCSPSVLCPLSCGRRPLRAVLCAPSSARRPLRAVLCAPSSARRPLRAVLWGPRQPGGHSEGPNTRSHPELGRENPQRRWYCVSRRGRAGRRQALPAPGLSYPRPVKPPARQIPGPSNPRTRAHHAPGHITRRGTSPPPPANPPAGATRPTPAGWSSPVARQAHNLKVVGSNPTPATNFPPPGSHWGPETTIVSGRAGARTASFSVRGRIRPTGSPPIGGFPHWRARAFNRASLRPGVSGVELPSQRHAGGSSCPLPRAAASGYRPVFLIQGCAGAAGFRFVGTRGGIVDAQIGDPSGFCTNAHFRHSPPAACTRLLRKAAALGSCRHTRRQ